MSHPMRFAIMGSGAVGGYFGGRLAQAKRDVTFIARGAHLDAIRANGLRIQSLDGDAVIRHVQATDEAASIGPVDTVIVAVKTWQLADAMELMKPLVGEQTALLPLLNGVEASDRLAAKFGADHVLNAMCRVISHVSEPGVVTHVGAVPTIVLGERDDRRSDRVRTVANGLRVPGITVEIPANIDAAVWTKMLLVVSLGGVGAVARAPAGVIRRMPETRDMLEAAMREICAVALARAVPLPADVVQAVLAFIDGLPPETETSLQRDIVAGRPSELDAWTGAVVRMGRNAGVNTPVNDMIYASLLVQERAARREE